MAEITQKDVLASISRLRGATSREVAADLGANPEEILPTVEDLAKRGFIRPLRKGIPVGVAGRERFALAELADAVLDVTFRGFVELRS